MNRSPASGLLLGMLVSALPCQASQPEAAESPAPVDGRVARVTIENRPDLANRTAPGDGVRIYVDAATGARTARGNAEQRAALSRGQGASDDPGFTQESLANGATLLRTHGRNQSTIRVVPGQGGSRNWQVVCDDPSHGEAAHRHESPDHSPR